ncbi:hypothetical protein B0J11DRAFT_519555 [Dendryphion nanum]|uniref:Hemerythrin-like domain-containing protein n=1 Tax=Dendryphion nanum TaxID=256645 RepID=A0A9P9IXK2_9PLEO|nr:hypothetical protein B0J11DRAFT_519555 [Dendryphion nanum]
MPRLKNLHLVLLVSVIGLFLYNRFGGTDMATQKRLNGDKPWADGPLELVKTPMAENGKDDTWTTGASHMALLHNSILRGFNSIYRQAPHVQPKDYADFIGYCLTWYKFIKAHHDAEEEDLFPQCLSVIGKEDREIWQTTHEEHEAMMAPLNRFYDYLNGLKSADAFSASVLISLLDDIKDSLSLHLHSEIVVIAALSKYGNFPAAEPALDAWGQRSVTGAGLLDVVPFMFLNHDRTYEDGRWKEWPQMPNVVRFIFVKGFSWRRSGWWKFASCDGDGRPRKLYALG